MFKKNILELAMAVMLLAGLFMLSREGAKLVANQAEEKKTVIIDAGHGAVDPGKVGVNGLKEKDVNLSIALKLEKILKKEGMNVVMTREDDSPLYSEGAQNKKAEDMQKRMAVINETKPDCVISIHQNSYTDPSVKGAQVFYFTHSDASKKIAEDMQELLREVDTGNTRQAKADSTYYMLKKTEVPTVIIE